MNKRIFISTTFFAIHLIAVGIISAELLIFPIPKRKNTNDLVPLEQAIDGELTIPKSLNIIQKRIPVTERRIELTKQYTQMHYGFKAADMGKPRIIVLHWTGGGTVETIYNAFYPDVLPSYRDWHKPYGAVNISAHFVVDRDGTIYQLFDETFIARHCIGMNYHAIGIENIGGIAGQEDLTNEQLESNILLVKYLQRKYSSIDLVIGHYEYRGYEGTPYFTELIPSYRNIKLDPGKEFMRLLRLGL